MTAAWNVCTFPWCNKTKPNKKAPPNTCLVFFLNAAKRKLQDFIWFHCPDSSSMWNVEWWEPVWPVNPELQILQSKLCMWGKHGCWHSQSCSLTTEILFVTALWPANLGWSTVEPPGIALGSSIRWIFGGIHLGNFWVRFQLINVSVWEAYSIIWYLQFQGFARFMVSQQETPLSKHEDYYYFSAVTDQCLKILEIKNLVN